MPVGLLGGKIILRAELPEALYSIVGVRGVDINLSIEGRGRRGPSNFLSWGVQSQIKGIIYPVNHTEGVRFPSTTPHVYAPV